MNVLYLLRYFPTLTETFVYREIDGLIARGIGVRVVAVGDRPDAALQDRVPAVEAARPPRLPLGSLRRARAARLGANLRPKDALRAAWVGEHARALGVDRIHAHFAGEAAEWARIAAEVAQVPFGVTVHATDLFRPRPGLGDLLGAAACVVTVAAHHQALLRERYGVSARLVRCGVDPAAAPRARPGEPGPLRVVSVARDVPKKGLDLLVEALRRVPGAALRLVSDRPASAAPGAEVGLLPPSAVAGVLAGAHVFALPCRVAGDGDADGIPVALMEALAAGLPVVTTPVSGIPELVDDTVGWLVPPDDVDALATALREAAARPDLRARRGAAGPGRLVERGFTVDRQVDGLLDAWKAAS